MYSQKGFFLILVYFAAVDRPLKGNAKMCRTFQQYSK